MTPSVTLHTHDQHDDERTLHPMPRILIVEDDPDIAGLIAHYMKKAGHSVEHLSTGAGVMDRVRAAAADLVILDGELRVVRTIIAGEQVWAA